MSLPLEQSLDPSGYPIPPFAQLTRRLGSRPREEPR